MATVVCIRIPELQELPSIELPGIGELAWIRDQIDSFPRPSEFLIKLLNVSMPALAPITIILRILDVILALVDCVNAIKRAVSRLSVGPIVDCLSNLLSALARLARLLPPFVYIKMLVDIVRSLRLLVEDLVNFLQVIDYQITRATNLINQAIDENNSAKLEIGQCVKNDAVRMSHGFMQLIAVMAKLIAIILGVMEVMSAVIPGDAGRKIAKAKQSVTAMQAELNSLTFTDDFPVLSDLASLLSALRGVLVFVEEFGSAIIGVSTSFGQFSLPEFTNP